VDAFLALADPHRRQIIELLAQGRRSAGDIAACFPISAPAVSQHLRTLRRTRLVHVEIRGQQRIYALAPDGFRDVDEWLGRYVRFWISRLDRLDAAIAQAAAPAPILAPSAKSPPPSGAHAKSRRSPAPRRAASPGTTRTRRKP
jgi:DNA-binding transcriptional ArsR family regulator